MVRKIKVSPGIGTSSLLIQHSELLTSNIFVDKPELIFIQQGYSVIRHGLQETRVNSGDGSFSDSLLTEENLGRVRALNAIAQKRGQSLAQMAIAWALRDPRVTTALIGARNVQQLDDSLDALKNLAFSKEELAEIDKYAVDTPSIDLWRSVNSR